MAKDAKYHNNLSYWIKQRGYQFYEVAEAVQIPRRTLSDYCSGRTAIPRYRLEALARFLECPIATLLGETEPHQEVNRSQPTPLPGEMVSSTHKGINSSLPADLQGIILQAASDLEGDDMDRLRRQLLEQALIGVGASLLAPYITAPSSEIAERLAKALTKPSHIDDSMLRYLERHTANYWQDRHRAVIASSVLLEYVLEHLDKIIALLEQSLLPQNRLRLCSLASQTAQLAGHLLFDMGAYSQARRFHTIAISAAHEAEDTALEAVAWGRMSFHLDL